MYIDLLKTITRKTTEKQKTIIKERAENRTESGRFDVGVVFWTHRVCAGEIHLQVTIMKNYKDHKKTLHTKF